MSILLNVPAHDYHRRELGLVSKSALDEIDRSPAHYKAWVDGIEAEPTPALRFGTALHMALLEPKRFSATYAVAPDFGDGRTKEGKAAKAAWLADNGGKLTLSAGDDAAIAGMIASVMAHPAASRLVLEGEPEVTLRWTDEISGLQCKSRADWWVKGKRFAVDLKSTLDASPQRFARDCANYRYHVQDALYRAGFAACGEPITHFVILAVEKVPPYAVAVYTLDEAAVAKGHAAARINIQQLADCIERNHFPSYSEGVEQLSLPAWAA